MSRSSSCQFNTCVHSLKEAGVRDVNKFALACNNANGTMLLSTKWQEFGNLEVHDAISKYKATNSADNPFLKCSEDIAEGCDWRQSVEDCMR